MLGTLEICIKYHSDEQGEALIEFIYALTSEKLTLKKSHLMRVTELLSENPVNEITKCLCAYILKRVLKPKPQLLADATGKN